MQARQVFSAYDWTGQDHSTPYKYCPYCQTPLIMEVSGGKQRPTCPNCGFVHFHNPSPGVVVIVEQDGQVLLGKRAADRFGEGKWCLPQGFIEYDDDFLTAAVREVKEETALDVEIRAIISVVSNFLTPDLHTLVIVLLAGVVAGEPHADDDLVEVAWFPLAGPLPEMAFAADQHIVERYHATALEGAPVDRDYARANP